MVTVPLERCGVPEPIVYELVRSGTVRAKIFIPARDRQDGLAAAAVFSVPWNGGGKPRHLSNLSLDCQNGTYRFGSSEKAALPTANRQPNSKIRKDLGSVGVTGLEPVTSTV